MLLSVFFMDFDFMLYTRSGWIFVADFLCRYVCLCVCMLGCIKLYVDDQDQYLHACQRFFCNRCMHCWSESVHAWPACMARPRIDRSLGFNMPMLLQEACCQKNALQL